MKCHLLIFMLFPIILASQNVGIGTNSPAESAKLEISSTSGGVLIPRLNNQERNAIPNPVTGLLIFNSTNNMFEFFDGSSWSPIAASGGNELSDSDGDTNIEVEQSVDEDIIRMTIGGEEKITIDGRTLHIKNTDYSTNIGEYAGVNNSSSQNWNTNLGYKAGELSLSGERNTLLGAFSGGKMTNLGNENVMIGLSAGYESSGSNNLFLGRDAGRLSAAGSNNTFLGHSAGRAATGSGNVFLGKDAGALETGSNLLFIDNSNTSKPLIYGDFSRGQVEINSKLSIKNEDSDGSNAAFFSSHSATGQCTAVKAVATHDDLNLGAVGVWGTGTGINGIGVIGKGKVGLASIGSLVVANNQGTSPRILLQLPDKYLTFMELDSSSYQLRIGDIDGETNNVSIFSNGSERITLMNNGNVGIGTTNASEALEVVGNICYTGTIGACSDIRYKNNFSPILSALSKVKQLNGRYYYWNQDQYPEKEFSSERQIGVIAQEVEALFPEMVLTNSEGYKSVDYSRLTPVLIEAIKELSSKNELLESQLQELSSLVHNNIGKEK